MADKYHINVVTGKVGKCEAEKVGCPLGGPNEHFPSEKEALAAFEEVMAGQTLPEPTYKDERRERLIAEAEKETILENQRPAWAPHPKVKSREEALEQAEELFKATEEIARKHLDMYEDKEPRVRPPGFPTKEESHIYFMKNMVDIFEDRNGEKLDDDTEVTISFDPGVAPIQMEAGKLGERLAPGSYEGTYLNPETGKMEPTFIGVYGDGTARARTRDLRQDNEYRAELAAKKKVELEGLISSWRERAASIKKSKSRAEYEKAIELGEQVLANTDWSEPVDVVNNLDIMENYYDKLEDKKKNPERAALADELFELGMDGYYLAGVQRLPSMKK